MATPQRPGDAAAPRAGRTRRLAPLIWMVDLVVAGCITIVWGALVYAGVENYPHTDPRCADAAGAPFRPLMPPWLVLVGLAVAGVVVWLLARARAREAGERPSLALAVLAALGVLAPLLLFPGWAVIANGLNCGL